MSPTRAPSASTASCVPARREKLPSIPTIVHNAASPCAAWASAAWSFGGGRSFIARPFAHRAAKGNFAAGGPRDGSATISIAIARRCSNPGTISGRGGPMENKATVRAAFIAVTTLFFAWGFITSLIDPLVAAVKGIFTLSDLQAQLSAFAFFIAYGVVSFPAAALIAKVKAVPAILMALAMLAIGCLIMLGAANVALYTLVLLGLVVLASGVTVLEGAGSPLAAALGSREGSHFRLTLSQTFHSLGTFIGPFLGAVLFLEGVEVTEGTAITPEVRDAALAGIDRAYFWICGLLLLLLAFFWFSRRTVADAAPET